MILISAEAELGVGHSSGEAIDKHGVTMAVDYVLELANQSGQAFGRQPTLKHRKLYALTVSFTYLRDPSQPDGANAVRLGDVIRNQDVHPSSDNKRRILWEVTAKMTGKHGRLN